METNDTREVFGLNWPGKSEARRLADMPVSAKLLGTGANDFHADHIFIEGDNLAALQLLLPRYKEQVKLIFIDPPYNTGSDRFAYNDDFGNKGDSHSAWLSMMLPRLMLARRMLRDDGVIFITIGDDEVHHLSLLMQEVFGEENFVANLLWRRRKTQANLSRLIAPVHDYILCYARNKPALRFNKVGYTEAFINKTFANKSKDPRGPYQTRPLAQPANSSNKAYALTMPDGRELTARWSCSPETFERYIREDLLHIPREGKGMPRLKIFLSGLEGAIPNTWLDNVASYEEGSKEIEQIFGSNAFFVSPKPTALIRHLIAIGAGKDDIILDFFAGSGTSAHAVALMNQADGGHRKSISIQLAEPTDSGSLAARGGFATIADICRERISRVLATINSSAEEKELPAQQLQSFSVCLADEPALERW